MQLETQGVAMTNEELSEAIKYTFDCCAQTYIGGYNTRETEAGKVMLAHLKELTTLQARRAGLLVVPPNAGIQRPGTGPLG